MCCLCLLCAGNRHRPRAEPGKKRRIFFLIPKTVPCFSDAFVERGEGGEREREKRVFVELAAAFAGLQRLPCCLRGGGDDGRRLPF